MGQQEFDFSNVINEPCTARSNSKQIQVKVTACGAGSFTCNDGECVSIDERCDQISNCRSVVVKVAKKMLSIDSKNVFPAGDL